MKPLRKQLPVLGAAVLVGALTAQPITAQLAIGVRGGYSSSTLSVDSPGQAGIDRDTRESFHVAGILQIPLVPLLNLQLQGLYSRQGNSFIDAVGEQFQIELDYFQIPLVGSFTFPTGNVRPRIFGGPNLGIETSCSTVNISDGVSANCDDPGVGFPTASIDVGWLFGGGLLFDVGPLDITIDGTYNLGILDVDDSIGSRVRNRKLEPIRRNSDSVIRRLTDNGPRSHPRDRGPVP